MDVLGTSAGWVAKGIVAGAKWLIDKMGELDGRLDVAAIRTIDGGFEVTVRWRVPSATEGYEVEASVIGPADAVLLEGVRKRTPAAPYLFNTIENVRGSSRVLMRLRHWPDDAEGQVSAVFYVSSAAFISAAHVGVSVRRIHNGRRLVTRKCVLSTPELGR